MSTQIDSEMEEGEIVDDVDELSDISSEEEFLLRQRLEVLESYNNVLERKKAKSSSKTSASRWKRSHSPLPDLSEISTTDLEDNFISHKYSKRKKHSKFHHKSRTKESYLRSTKYKESKQRSIYSKKKTEHKSVECSDESQDEYRNKRENLANAVSVHRNKNDRSTLSDRLQKMISSSIPHNTVKQDTKNDKQNVIENDNQIGVPSFPSITSIITENTMFCSEENMPNEEAISNFNEISALIDLCREENDQVTVLEREEEKIRLDKLHADSSVVNIGQDVVDSVISNENENLNTDVPSEKESDDDLELLRQNVLKTKITKSKPTEDIPVSGNKNTSEDEDSDTAELRLICLRSAFLKKAIEMKQKQKLQKRISQSSIHDEYLGDNDELLHNLNSENNTDIESVDMEIGSDTEGKINEEQIITEIEAVKESDVLMIDVGKEINNKHLVSKEDEIDEDEDLLRAKLLTSLSKNLPKFLKPSVEETVEKLDKDNNSTTIAKSVKVPEEKKFIIKLGESDSEGEHEATKNLTKMHLKLSEQSDFQQKLDAFLKTTRLEVEKNKLPDVVQKQTTPKKPEKFVAKAVKHLPKSEQIEYKNLVKRMAELEKLKLARQITLNATDKASVPVKDTLKPRNVSINSTAMNNNLEEKINMSRKKIAEESAKMLKLKEEGKKLIQKQKIVATELRNITTAITFNKKELRSAQITLSKIRAQHQALLRSSTIPKHSKTNGLNPVLQVRNNIMPRKLQKENNPSKEAYKNPQALKAVKVSIVNDLKKEDNVTNMNLSIQVNVKTNKKNVEVPKTTSNKMEVNIINIDIQKDALSKESEASLNKEKDKGSNEKTVICDTENNTIDDYQSPLQALGSTTWQADPNAILCPFEVGGDCRDSECKFLHTKTS